MYGIIYKATNLVNSKVYIGQTSRSLNDRVRQHIADATGLRNSRYVFHIAIRKYGAKNFKFEVIDCANTKEELNDKELFWIKNLQSYIRDENCHGYNMTIGGSTGSGENSVRYGAKHTEKAKRLISENHADFSGEKKSILWQES